MLWQTEGIPHLILDLIFSELNSPIEWFFWGARHEPPLGPANRRTLPLAGVCACFILPFPESLPTTAEWYTGGGTAPVLPVSELSPDPAGMLQFFQIPLDRGAGQSQIRGNGLDSWPSEARGRRAVPQINVDRFAPVGQAVLSIDALKITHWRSPPL